MEYCYVIGLRDLFWVRRLMLERELLRKSRTGLGLWQLVDDAKAIVTYCEEAVMYIMHWSELQGWTINFEKMEGRRQEQRTEDHPCNLIMPYLIPLIPKF